ncbi:hypothetical protein E6P09_12965 [Haloferax mediterranei ATCC 33500]|uniref:Glycine zipper-like domain-containing protein n=1 Tax=Haloferax mediterranei (strain ATCC 33500 / DSM 1411 / JCM 8866 / NBRC 14739 / NCIMB 2177 / R-4) TaxID=523841 RepID=I3R879_HALMT|nr:hypothetical protein [Haloferax mediterranei]AFK20439.1 hypothetical protein HFX_2762 [Haloferax mediterranei ATCC 33500]AHZ23801.1 hypothetical protein BM92_14620 [Haloferax mediterranei ATCC 33500]ELZ98223.1 hypothetical protein C439_15600 [Haloferax mediterranei ATCC 33500]MDX5986805.1 hypothetical protein [Haloferax mediterranei ATCC 33500]QCQ76129.1 hypothetical protein E6P09_12965 [Haloferax mediterranei ATCC 33500]
MSQESVSLSAESIQQQAQTESTDHKMVDSDDHEGSSHSAEQFGIGLTAGFLLGGILGVLTNSLSLGVMLGLTVGVVFGVVLMEYR